MKYTAPVDSTLFLLREVLKFDNELTEPILKEAAKICEEVIAPTNQEGDKEGCKYVEGKVQAPQAFKEAYEAFSGGGWTGLSVPEQYGGQGLPFTLAVATNEFVSSSNMAFSLYPGISRGAIQALLVSGNDWQKTTYIPKMASGEWTGTMCLTEPHCGTDLGLLKTKAVVDKGFWRITGQKIFISGGAHDLTDNIMHLVLARVEGDPEGVKGISMFAVPKMLNSEHNHVSCGSIENKMGIHGSPTCVMNFDGAVGTLVGERCKGLQAMFIMMNEMRLGCAIHGLSQSELAYQNALSYAKERFQGTALTDKGGLTLILSHPDVRRMLMDVRCVNEAARLLILEAATLVDKGDEASEDRLSLLTPVLKGVLTDYGVDNAIKMQQVWGGHGYVRDNGMEQIVRDARIAMIYEGTNGVQALDLVGRKLPKNMGRAIRRFLDDSKEVVNQGYGDEHMNIIVQPVAAALNDLNMATQWLVDHAIKNPNDAGSASYDYMKMFGLVLLGLAHIRICSAPYDKTRYDNALYFGERLLPETRFLLERIRHGSSTMMGAEFD